MEGLFGIILGLIGFVLIVTGIVAAIYAKLGYGYRPPKKLSVGLIVGGIVLFLASMSIVIIPPGSVGVVTFLGAVQEETLPPGIHVRIPILNAVRNFETRVQAHNFQDLDASSKENLQLKITGTMNYHIDGSKASELYQTLSDDFAAKVIDPAFADYIKQIVPTYSADSSAPDWVLAHRDDIRLATKSALNENLARYHIIVDDIYIANIGNPEDYEAAIRARQVAQQQVATEQQVTQQKTQQANQAVEIAKGQANAAIESSRGTAAQIEAIARAQANANKLLADSLSPEVLQYNLIQKLAGNVSVIMLPTTSNFLLDPKSLIKPQ